MKNTPVLHGQDSILPIQKQADQGDPFLEISRIEDSIHMLEFLIWRLPDNKRNPGYRKKIDELVLKRNNLL